MKPSPRKAAKLIVSLILVQLLPILPWANVAGAAETVAGAPAAKETVALCQKRVGEIVALARAGKMRQAAALMAFANGKALDYDDDLHRRQTNWICVELLTVAESLVYKGVKIAKTYDKKPIAKLFYTAMPDGKPKGMSIDFSLIEGEHRLITIADLPLTQIEEELGNVAPAVADPAAVAFCQKRVGEIAALARAGKMREASALMGIQGKLLNYDDVGAPRRATTRHCEKLLAVAESLVYKGADTKKNSAGVEALGLFYSAMLDGKPDGVVIAFSRIEGEYRLVDIDDYPLDEMEELLRKK